MSSLVSAIQRQTNTTARTFNGAVTNKSSLSSVIDLFFIAGASRGKDISSTFAKAFYENDDLSIRLALWLRDAREGAGERAQFRNIFGWLIQNDRSAALRVLAKIPVLGRWDDVFTAIGTNIEQEAVALIKQGIRDSQFKKGILERLETMSDLEAQNILDSLV